MWSDTHETADTQSTEQDEQMRFMTMVKSKENLGFPPQALMVGIAKLGEEAGRAGVLPETCGLGPTATGAIVRLSGGS